MSIEEGEGYLPGCSLSGREDIGDREYTAKISHRKEPGLDIPIIGSIPLLEGAFTSEEIFEYSERIYERTKDIASEYGIEVGPMEGRIFLSKKAVYEDISVSVSNIRENTDTREMWNELKDRKPSPRSKVDFEGGSSEDSERYLYGCVSHFFQWRHSNPIIASIYLSEGLENLDLKHRLDEELEQILG